MCVLFIFLTPLLQNRNHLSWIFGIDRGFACEWLVGVNKVGVHLLIIWLYRRGNLIFNEAERMHAELCVCIGVYLYNALQCTLYTVQTSANICKDAEWYLTYLVWERVVISIYLCRGHNPSGNITENHNGPYSDKKHDKTWSKPVTFLKVVWERGLRHKLVRSVK